MRVRYYPQGHILMDEVHPPSGACITVCPLGINQHTLFLKPGLQAFQEFFIADYFQHRPKGHED